MCPQSVFTESKRIPLMSLFMLGFFVLSVSLYLPIKSFAAQSFRQYPSKQLWTLKKQYERYLPVYSQDYKKTKNKISKLQSQIKTIENQSQQLSQENTYANKRAIKKNNKKIEEINKQVRNEKGRLDQIGVEYAEQKKLLGLINQELIYRKKLKNSQNQQRAYQAKKLAEAKQESSAEPILLTNRTLPKLKQKFKTQSQPSYNQKAFEQKSSTPTLTKKTSNTISNLEKSISSKKLQVPSVPKISIKKFSKFIPSKKVLTYGGLGLLGIIVFVFIKKAFGNFSRPKFKSHDTKINIQDDVDLFGPPGALK